MNFISTAFQRSFKFQLRNTSYFSKVQQNDKTFTEKVMQMVSDMSFQKTPTIQQSHIKDIAKNLNYVESAKKQTVLKYFLAALYSRSVNIDLLKNQELEGTLKYYPVIKIQLNIHIINQLKKQKIENNQDNDQLINDKFLQCFKEILPTIKIQYEQMKARSLLYKNFGRYLIEQNQLKKGLETLQHSIYEHKKLIKDYSKKLEESIDSKKNDQDLQKQDDATKKIRINAMKQNIRKLLESMFEVMMTYYDCQKKSSQTATGKQRQQIILYTLALIKECFQIKQIIAGIRYFSMYYHKLKKIQLELQFILAINKKDKKKLQKIVKQMNDFSKDSFSDLKKANEYLSILKQISIAIISIRLHLVKLENKSDLKTQLVSCSQEIVSNLQQKNKQVILKLLGEFIKKQTKA